MFDRGDSTAIRKPALSNSFVAFHRVSEDIGAQTLPSLGSGGKDSMDGNALATLGFGAAKGGGSYLPPGEPSAYLPPRT